MPDDFVERAHIFNPNFGHPLAVFVEDVDQLGVIDARVKHLRPAGAGIAQHKTIGIAGQGKGFQVAGGWHHVTVHVAAIAVERVNGHIRFFAAFEQPQLIVGILGLKQSFGLVDGNTPFFNGQVGLHQITHAGFELFQLGRGKRRPAFHLAIERPKIQAIINDNVDAGEQFAGGRHQQKRERAAVNAHPVAFSHCYHVNIQIPVGMVGQLAQLAVNQAGHGHQLGRKVASPDKLLNRRVKRPFEHLPV